MSDIKVIYSASARSFSTDRPIQKMIGVISGIKKAGANVVFIGGGDLYPRKSYSASMGGNSAGHSLKNRGWVKESFSEFLDILHDVAYGFYLLPIFIKCPYAILLERSSRLHIASILLAKLFKRKVLLEWKDHLVDYESSLFKSWALLVEDLKVKLSDCILVESKVLEFTLRETYSDARFHVAYNAVDLDGCSEDRLQKSHEKDIDFLYAGGYADYHDMLCLVEAANILNSRHISARFVCVGNGPHRAKMESRVNELGLKFNFEFIDAMSYSQLMRLYGRAIFGILPGCTDIICPIKIFEYMGFGLVPVIPDYLCNKEILNGDAAIYFEPGSAHSFADAIQKCLSFLLSDSGRDYLDGISLQNFRLAKNNYNWVSTWGGFVASEIYLK